MNPQSIITDIMTMRQNLMAMDANYRAQRSRYTPVEIADALKALRMLQLSIEAGGMAYCFEEAHTE